MVRNSDIDAVGNDSVAWLQESGKRIRIFPDRDLRALRSELIVMDTPRVQRLRRVKQLGLASLIFPTAEHTRFGHSLGTVYWTGKFLRALRTNYFGNANTKRIGQMQAALGEGISLDIVARLYALTHDMFHLPFGHTLEDQFGYYARHDEDRDRIEHCFARLKEELSDPSALQWSPNADDVRQSLFRHLSYVRAVVELDRLLSGLDDTKFDLPEEELRKAIPALLFIHDLVSNTLCADLVDYSLRDSLFASIPRTFDKILLAYLSVLQVEAPPSLRRLAIADGPVFRFGVSAVRKTLRHDVITALISLLRTRYELAEKVNYHHAKCAADAMLDRLLRGSVPVLPTSLELVEVGDEDLLSMLRSNIREGPDENLKQCMYEFEARRLYKEVFRVSFGRTLTEETDSLLERARSPEGRSEIEAELCRHLPMLNPVDVIFSSRPAKMQMKWAGALIRWVDGRCKPLAQIAEEYDYAREVQELTRRYRSLWSCSVYVTPRKFDVARRVAEVCERREFFAIKNDDALQRMLDVDSRIPLTLHREVDSIRDNVLTEALAVSSARGAEPDVRDLYAQEVGAPTGRARSGNGKRRKQQANSPELSFEAPEEETPSSS